MEVPSSRELAKAAAPPAWPAQALRPGNSIWLHCDNRGPTPPWTCILTTGELHHSLSFHPSTCQQLLPEVRHLPSTTSRL